MSESDDKPENEEAEHEIGFECQPNDRSLEVARFTFGTAAKMLGREHHRESGGMHFVLVAVPTCSHGTLHPSLAMKNTMVATTAQTPQHLHAILDALHRKLAYLARDLVEIEVGDGEGH